ncbi:hypothetical protein PT974_04165 [Cladobotryum mycophilum]|uniref:Ribosomal RNA-processing protein 14/surfeit locus protein 6 C-terminal domain-containing protein n=1 Tax=Cladobotryum mycophilum TaxID=491253 RepID=A0ABR0SV09_9HYPO
MGDSLQDRLRDHAKAFDGLLSLIPAKMYYGEDNSDQWKKEKQTKQEAAAARRAKLDPDSALNRNAKEVMDERANNRRKVRQRDQEEQEPEEESYEPVDGVEAERPREGLKPKSSDTPSKKVKTEDEDESNDNGDDAEEEAKAEKKVKVATGEAQPSTKSQPKKAEEPVVTQKPKKQKAKKAAKEAAVEVEADPEQDEASSDVQMEDDAQTSTGGLAPSLDFSGLTKEDEGSALSAPESELHSPTFDTSEISTIAVSAEAASTTTSISSTIPPSEKPKHLKIPADTAALKARLAAKIEALRAARKADGPDGKPIRTRQELIESRRVKEAQRKEHKKELRRLARIEESKKREEALASNSPGVMSPAVGIDDSTGGFSFGRVAFADGAQMSHDLSYFLSKGKKKGPSDPKTALLKVQNQKKRLEELDEEKRKDITDKEAWLTARRRIEGEKIRDDETLLKKAVKRKETTKKKSEKAWKERSSGVAQAQRERQKKREENIKQRRDDKLLHRSGKKKKGGAKKKKGGRPGFEGSLGVGGRK